jgi:hypothetical protein
VQWPIWGLADAAPAFPFGVAPAGQTHVQIIKQMKDIGGFLKI